MAADGSIRVNVTANDTEARKALERLNKEIDKTQKKLSEKEAKKDSITADLQRAQEEADKTAAKLEELKKIQEAETEAEGTKQAMLDIDKDAENALQAYQNAKKEYEAAVETANRKVTPHTTAIGRIAIQDARKNLSSLEEEYKKAEQELDAVAQKSADLTGLYNSQVDAVTQAREAAGVSDEESITAAISEQERLNKGRQADVEKLKEKEQAVTKEVEEQNRLLNSQKEQAGAIRKQLTEVPPNSFAQLKESINGVNVSLKKGFKNILKWGFGIRSAFILMRRLRSAIKEGINTFAEYDDETRANIGGLKNSLTGLKASWGAAFAPILNAVAPVLQKLISLLVTAANYVQMFFSVLRGGVSYKKVIANNDALAKSYGGAGSAAKEAKKQLMSFDEINKLDSNDSGGGGGGGGGGASPIEGAEDTLIPEDTLKKLQWVKDHLKEILAVAGAVGVAIAAWKIAGAAADILKIWKAFKVVLGVIMAIAGAVLFVKGYLDAWTNGVNWENLKQMLIGVALLVAGLGLAFGTTGLAIGLLIASVAMLVLGFKEWIETGKLSEETFTMMELAIMGVGIALSLLTGSWIPAVIAAVAMVVLAIVKNWDSIKAAFESAWNWIKTTAKGWWDKVVTYVDGIKTRIVEKFEQIKQGIVDKITTAKNKVKEAIDKVKEFFNFKWELPHISLPHITVSWEAVTGDNPIAKLLGIGALPHFGIQWYARGGIVDQPTLFGAGEAGKEAVVPLERNTEWVGMVARGIVDSLTSDNRLGDYISGKVLPSVVSGQIVPPRALAGGGSMLTDGDIERLVNGITAALTANDGEEHTPVIIDGRVVAEIVTRHQRRMERGFA